jgi:L,D-transpeptidase catalytic domain
MRRNSVITMMFMFGAAVKTSDAEAKLDLYVDKSTQQMQVVKDGRVLYVWPVSTGRDRFSTPSGVYTPERMERTWFSRAYYDAPMPHAIFFRGGYAIHGSYAISKLGGPASHGCVRLHPRNAALLFGMVQQEGPSNTTIVVGGHADRPPLRYRDYDEPLRSAYRNGPLTRGANSPSARMPPVEGADRYAPDRSVNRDAAYPPSAPETARHSPYYPSDRAPNPNAYPRGSEDAPYYDADRYGDGPRPPQRSPGIEPDYAADPYVDQRSAPYRPNVPPYYAPDRRGEGRFASPHGPRMPPLAPDHSVDGLARRRGDSGPVAMRGGEPATRMPAPRFEGDGSLERIPAAGGNYRPAPTGAKPRLNRPADESPSRRVTMGDTAKAPPPAPPSTPPAVSLPSASPPSPAAPQDLPPAPQPSTDYTYKILPPSYWAGASWRWRAKRDTDTVPPAASP